MCQFYAHIKNRKEEESYRANPTTDKKGKVEKIKYVFYENIN
jgi:hypothetical protein